MIVNRLPPRPPPPPTRVPGAGTTHPECRTDTDGRPPAIVWVIIGLVALMVGIIAVGIATTPPPRRCLSPREVVEWYEVNGVRGTVYPVRRVYCEKWADQ